MNIRLFISIFILTILTNIAIAQKSPFEVDWRLNAIHDLQVLGWSDDENYYAIRLYSIRFEENYLIEGRESLPKDCEGYIMHTGRKFDGGLSLHIFYRNNVIENHPIQDLEECTSIAIAKKRLRQAKSALKKYKIRTESPGENLMLENNRIIINDEDRGQYVLEYKLAIVKTLNPSTPDYEQHTGSHELRLVSKNVNQLILKKTINERFNVTMLHRRVLGIDSAYLSPSKEKILIYCFTDDSGMTHKYRALWLLAMLEWRYGTLKVCFD